MVYRLPNRALAARFGVICGRKVSHSAVKRNRLKRIVRAELAQLLPKLPTRYDYLAVLRSAATQPAAPVREELRSVLADLARKPA